MRKLIVGTLLTFCVGFAAASNDWRDLSSVGYEMTEKGYLNALMQVKQGMVVTNNHHSEIYLLRNNQLEPLVSSPGCGRYTTLNADKTLLGFKRINEYGDQAPAVLEIATGKITLLEDYTNQCGQVSFSQDGTMAYTVENTLIINRNGVKTTYDLGYHTNIVNLSPDGSSVAFSDYDGKPVVMHLQTATQTQVADMMEVYNPKWSPDGKKIVFERSDMELYVYEAEAKKFTYLSKGSGAQWLDDSENLVFTTAEYENGNVFKFKGSSVNQMSYDGKVKRVLVATSQECPQSVSVIDGERIAVAYAHGNRRIAALRIGTSAMRKVSSATPQTTAEEVLYALPNTQVLRKVHKPFLLKHDAPAIRKKADVAQSANLIGEYDIPYINQVTDVPYSSIGNCIDYGPCACAPSTACMILGYYGLLEPHAVASRASGTPWGKYVYYSWYVGQPYTSPQTGFVFNEVAYEYGCAVQGGHGYMWTTGCDPVRYMDDFYIDNGISGAKNLNTGLAAIRQECNAGYPYSWCITSSLSQGHLILPFRADVDFNKGVFGSLTGTIVCHDPFGDANCWDGYWAETDGRHSSYDCPGYNNGYIQMTNAWGVVARYDKPAAEPELTFTEGWNYSGNTSKTDWTSDFTVLRNMDYGAGKLYVVNTSGAIHVIDARTGVKLKNLSMTGVDGGTIKVMDCKYVDGKIIACNLATTSNSNALKVYVWDNDNADPRVLLNTTNFAGFARIGDCIGVKGNVTNGSLHFACANSAGEHSVVYYTITNGICSTTPTTKALTNAGAAVKLGSSPRVIPNADGTWWANGGSRGLALFSADGKQTLELPTAAVGGVVSGNAFQTFTFNGKTYGVCTTYDTPVSGDSESSLKNGRAVLIDATKGWSSALNIGEYPKKGLGTKRNTSFSTSVATAVNGTQGVEMWVLVHSQGIAYYKYGVVPDTSENPNPNPNPNPTTPDATYGAVNFFYQGGTLVVPADNEALWDVMGAAFDAAYPSAANKYTSYSSVAKINDFIKAQHSAGVINTLDVWLAEGGAWKWLGDYMLAHESTLPTTTSWSNITHWRVSTDAFFQATTASALHGDFGYGDWTTAGKPTSWQPAYTFAHQPTKANDTFLGWFDNAAGNGSALTKLPSSGNVYACWKNSSTTTDLENVEAPITIIPTFTGVAISFEGTENIAIYKVNGSLVASGEATNFYECDLQSGLYIIRVGAKACKFVR